MCFGRRLWVAPHHAHVHTTGAVIVRLDPGLAFGTGTHATTAMCLAWLDEHAADGQLAIDYGCGSGVLAVAAAKLGARASLRVRHRSAGADRHARQRRRERRRSARARRSNATRRCPPARTSCWLTSCAARCASSRRDSRALTRPGGRIVLAGLLDAQADEVARAHAPWFDIEPFATRDGWTALDRCPQALSARRLR